MKPLPPGSRRIASFRYAAFTPFVFPDGVRLGDEVQQLDTTRPLDEGFHIYRMPPGMKTRGHRHSGIGQAFVVEGDLIDSDGTMFRPGDLLL